MSVEVVYFSLVNLRSDGCVNAGFNLLHFSGLNFIVTFFPFNFCPLIVYSEAYRYERIEYRTDFLSINEYVVKSSLHATALAFTTKFHETVKAKQSH